MDRVAKADTASGNGVLGRFRPVDAQIAQLRLAHPVELPRRAFGHTFLRRHQFAGAMGDTGQRFQEDLQPKMPTPTVKMRWPDFAARFTSFSCS